MRKLKIQLGIGFLLLTFLFSCKTDPNEKMGIMKITGISCGQKEFFKKNGRYGTFDELVDADLVDSDSTRSWGYKSDVKITATGYFASVIPNDITKASMFYVDEKGIIKRHSGDTNIKPDDPDCSYPNGAKCVCLKS